MIDADILAGVKRSMPFVVPWATKQTPAALLEFSSPNDWLSFLEERSLSPYVPQIVSSKYNRAQRLYALSWLDFDLIKAGELVAITALELALKDCYAGRMSSKRPMLDALLRYLVNEDHLTDDALPFTRLYGGSVNTMLFESDAAGEDRRKFGRPEQTTLASIRNGLAHGDPFDGLPWNGLLELIRDLIEYAYRDMIGPVSGSTL
ncbi:hypothetical protein ELI44_30095 (plasmid) [Rhizobium ruizarguesonis]|uniref:hypothetical protein n=1 Tax=Rhizobium ruizarguesonis TaxID=2081791 RepID=UPI0010314673|nr:hypothetical protein [Rhizobium ruizarguesonis]TAU38386.1 hypothetical protein ELI42_30075 [Rhizobium ruizarguesonis]TAU56018.1 hypothetical protein ELI44_30095 [Rhizobium ruizarguesonis]